MAPVYVPAGSLPGLADTVTIPGLALVAGVAVSQRRPSFVTAVARKAEASLVVTSRLRGGGSAVPARHEKSSEAEDGRMVGIVPAPEEARMRNTVTVVIDDESAGPARRSRRWAM